MLSLIFALLLIIALAAFSGAIQQWPRAVTIGQKIETIFQIVFACLSLFVWNFKFICRGMIKYIRLAWGVSLVSTTVLSTLVWGPSMLLPTLVFGVASALIAYGILLLIYRIEVV